jgi:hypothetical protein
MDKALPIAVLTLFTLSGAGARASEDPTPELNAERDQLIVKIRDGVDYDASVKRFAELLGKRDAVIATTESARAKERERQQAERAERDAKFARKKAYEHTADWDVAWRCTLSPDPAHPVPSTEGRYKGDWGKVTRKEQVRLQPKNELDEGELITLFEVAGIKQQYTFRADHASYDRKVSLDVTVGDLVLVCSSGEHQDNKLPPGWGKVNSGFAVRLAAPPRIAKKARWNPIHVTGAALFWAVKDVKWKYPPGAYILFNTEIDEDLGGGKFRIGIHEGREMSWIMQLAPNVKPPVPMLPGQHVWAILGNPRFDKTEKTLVLTAEDLEEHYVDEKP